MCTQVMAITPRGELSPVTLKHSNLTASISGYTLKGILIKLKRKILTVFSNTIVGGSLVFLLLLCVLRDKTNE